MESTTWHYPPDFLELMVGTTAILVRSKVALCSFFEGAGLPVHALRPLRERIATEPDSVRMAEIARTAIETANRMEGDSGLAMRREIVRRVAQFAAFDACWPDNRDKARGRVAQVQDYVRIHTAATRYVEDMERERRRVSSGELAKRQAEADRQAKRSRISAALNALFSHSSAQRRGKQLESVLNRLFELDGVSVIEAFEVRSEDNSTLEQIDGVIELDSSFYLVELKWWTEPLGPGDVSQHLVRVFGRGQARGVLIANPGFTKAAVHSVRENLHQAPFVLAELEEVVRILADDVNVREWLRPKIQATVLNKEPFTRYSPLR